MKMEERLNEKLLWYGHRLRAMTPAELAGHARRSVFQRLDGARRSFPTLGTPAAAGRWPVVGSSSAAVRDELEQDARRLLAGQWTLFRDHSVQVDLPPRWQRDAIAGVDVASTEPFHRLNHRALRAGADIKSIWDLSRWTQLVRLAQAAHACGLAEAGDACRRCLVDWAERNPPFRGWNWTSALESGIRLIQMAWLDALLDVREPLARLLPAHAHYTWRYRCFGSSANNHLLGELTGLVVAVARWPELAGWSAPLGTLRGLWEREVLAQFAPDGGNREQALRYHLFSLEFALHGERALAAAGEPVSPAVRDRMAAAAQFLLRIQEERDPWDYGDSDDSAILPVAAQPYPRWIDWLQGGEGGGLRHWLGEPPGGVSRHAGWQHFPDTGFLAFRAGGDLLRWDLSPLGYLSMAAHGHCDALHVSLWREGVALVVDPGTGAYYADRPLREQLVSWRAHNGPVPEEGGTPVHRGPFLWERHHAAPRLVERDDTGGRATLTLPAGEMMRAVHTTGAGWQVEDRFAPAAGTSPVFRVRWQFAPGGTLDELGGGRFRFQRGGVSLIIRPARGWTSVRVDRDGVVSPSFRRTAAAPALCLEARGGGEAAVTEFARA